MGATVLDRGNGYEVAPPLAYVALPAGRYYPAFIGPQQNLFLGASPAYNPDSGLDYSADARRMAAQHASDTEIESAVLDNSYFPMHQWNTGLERLHADLNAFLARKTHYTRRGLGYKRSLLFFGPPGTGKSQYILWREKQLIRERDAIVLRVELMHHLNALTHGSHLNDLARATEGRIKVIVIEELADFCREMEMLTAVLQLLDSSVIRNDLLFLITTNHPEEIPTNLIDRPSRLDVIERVDVEGLRDGFVEAWYEHLTREPFPAHIRDEPWYAEARRDLSPAYWKELFTFALLHDLSPGDAWLEIARRREMIRQQFRDSKLGFGFARQNGRAPRVGMVPP